MVPYETTLTMLPFRGLFKITERWGQDYPAELLKNPKFAFLNRYPYNGKVRGMGWPMPDETPIHPMAPGKVTFSGRDSQGSLSVVVDHGDGYTSLYGHLQYSNYPVGARVNCLNILAGSGHSGACSGPMLYVRVKKDGKLVDPQILIDRRCEVPAPAKPKAKCPKCGFEFEI